MIDPVSQIAIDPISEKAFEYLNKRNELPYYSIDSGASIIADEFSREVLRKVSLLERAAYIYGFAKSSKNPGN